MLSFIDLLLMVWIIKRDPNPDSESGRLAYVPVQFLHEMLSGFLAVPSGEPFGAIRITAVDGLEDRLMLIPDRVAHSRLLQHHPHGATNVPPVMAGAFRDQRIAGRVVDQIVKAHVGIDHSADA